MPRNGDDKKPNRAYNVLGTPLQTCSVDPITGFYRDGCCNTGPQDRGLHMICCVMTDEFLTFSKERGNDLSTPMPQYHFPGLKVGDQWCVCALRWVEAYKNGQAPKVRLESTHQAMLQVVPLEVLQQFAVEESSSEE